MPTAAVGVSKTERARVFFYLLPTQAVSDLKMPGWPATAQAAKLSSGQAARERERETERVSWLL